MKILLEDGLWLAEGQRKGRPAPWTPSMEEAQEFNHIVDVAIAIKKARRSESFPDAKLVFDL